MTDLEAIERYKEIETAHLQTLADHDGIATNWTLYHTKTNPGFFTSFNQKNAS